MTALVDILLFRTLAGISAIDPRVVDSSEVVIAATEVRFVETKLPETVLRARPWVPHRRLATIAHGTRLAVRGIVASRDAEGCHGKPWYAVWPFGFVCSEHVKPTSTTPDPSPAVVVAQGQRLPFAYAIVREGGAPIYAGIDDVRFGRPERVLEKGMSLSIERSVDVDGTRYLQDSDGKLVLKDGVRWMGQGSPWQGVSIDYDREGPGPMFGWVRPEIAKVRARPSHEAPILGGLARRERVPLGERHDESGRTRWWRVGEGWVDADDLNEVIAIRPPAAVADEHRMRTTGNDQWIDVDLGEQVLVAYRGFEPVYATLVSSGRSMPTPRGNYPIWAKVASMDMANQEYEDKPYLVQDVPWVLLFQGHNALHGAYWHDRFGHRKSHGCVNLAPLDAKWLFEWIAPSLAKGWTGFLPSELQRSAVVHVRDSSRPAGDTFTQERPIGPPDREEEQRKLEEAERRRSLADAALDPPGYDEPRPAMDEPLLAEPTPTPRDTGGSKPPLDL